MKAERQWNNIQSVMEDNDQSKMLTSAKWSFKSQEK